MPGRGGGRPAEARGIARVTDTRSNAKLEVSFFNLFGWRPLWGDYWVLDLAPGYDYAVVGTPGRIMDHLEKGTLDLSELRFLVLDEADEMLNMGFAEDVETILADTPDDKNVALFSATMPAQKPFC